MPFRIERLPLAASGCWVVLSHTRLHPAGAAAPACCRTVLWACTLTALTTSVAVGVSMPVSLSNYIRRQCGEATRPSTSAPADEHKGPPWLVCTSCNQSRRTCLRISLSPNARPSTDGAHGAPIKEGYLTIRYTRYISHVRYRPDARHVRQRWGVPRCRLAPLRPLLP